MTERKLHCWKGRAPHIEELHGFHSDEHRQAAYIDMPATCMLERDHDGEHVFTPDESITFTFAPVEKLRSP